MFAALLFPFRCSLVFPLSSRLLPVLFWNVRGLAQDEKCSKVKCAHTAINPGIVCLQESKLELVSYILTSRGCLSSLLTYNRSSFSSLLVLREGSLPLGLQPISLSLSHFPPDYYLLLYYI